MDREGFGGKQFAKKLLSLQCIRRVEFPVLHGTLLESGRMGPGFLNVTKCMAELNHPLFLPECVL
jgi:hypothetical protein